MREECKVFKLYYQVETLNEVGYAFSFSFLVMLW